jgi:hypothetical protein
MLGFFGFLGFGRLWVFVLFQHASTTTHGLVLHGFMVFLWRKTHSPHTIRQRGTKQTQIATCFTNSLVAAAKIFSPHKREQTKNPTKQPTFFDLLLYRVSCVC